MRIAFLGRSAVLVLAAASCSQPQRLVRFHAPTGADEPVDALVRAFVLNGEQPAEVDAKSGIVHTQWQDTGFMYGAIRNRTATIHRRYTAIVTKGAAGADVVLRIDTRRCTPPETVMTTTTTVKPGTGTTISMGEASVTIGGQPPQAHTEQTVQHVDQPCEPMDGIVENHQAALDDLGQKLRAALGATPNAG
jgi:hypothetical protein